MIKGEDGEQMYTYLFYDVEARETVQARDVGTVGVFAFETHLLRMFSTMFYLLHFIQLLSD